MKRYAFYINNIHILGHTIVCFISGNLSRMMVVHNTRSCFSPGAASHHILHCLKREHRVILPFDVKCPSTMVGLIANNGALVEEDPNISTRQLSRNYSGPFDLNTLVGRPLLSYVTSIVFVRRSQPWHIGLFTLCVCLYLVLHIAVLCFTLFVLFNPRLNRTCSAREFSYAHKCYFPSYWFQCFS